MTPREEQQAQWWWRARAKGKARFILLHGVIGWGVLVAILVSLMQWLLQMDLTTSKLVLNAILYPLAGIAFGWWLWRHNEKKFGTHPGG